MTQDLFCNFRYIFIRELFGRGADGRCLCCPDEHVHLADVGRGLEFVNGAAVLGPDKQVGRYPGSGRFYKDSICVAFDLESIASRGCHRDRLADFNDRQVVQCSVDLGDRLLLSIRGQGTQAGETETQDESSRSTPFSLRAMRGQLTGAQCAFAHRVPSP